jgi:hypothetical protein
MFARRVSHPLSCLLHIFRFPGVKLMAGGAADALHLPPKAVSIEGVEGQNHLNFDFALAAFDNSNNKGQPSLTSGKTIYAQWPRPNWQPSGPTESARKM